MRNLKQSFKLLTTTSKVLLGAIAVLITVCFVVLGIYAAF